MSVFRFPCSHDVSITQTITFGYLNPPSKASGIVVALFQMQYNLFPFQDPEKIFSHQDIGWQLNLGSVWKNILSDILFH